ncbi:hypothetical protein DFH09DRAFT_1314430 [Mycena vulgaris]|nr:hypothetical protein DFH09DRAFT_1314430 [Mycena vulgaris]
MSHSRIPGVNDPEFLRVLETSAAHLEPSCASEASGWRHVNSTVAEFVDGCGAYALEHSEFRETTVFPQSRRSGTQAMQWGAPTPNIARLMPDELRPTNHSISVISFSQPGHSLVNAKSSYELCMTLAHGLLGAKVKDVQVVLHLTSDL